MTELVGMDVTDAGGLGDPVEHASDLMAVEGAAFPGNEPVDVVLAGRRTDTGLRWLSRKLPVSRLVIRETGQLRTKKRTGDG
jgi:hypothetical protein